jgi:hypothetical protein
VSGLVRDGRLFPPSGPGWGVEINEAELTRHPFREVWHSQIGAEWKELDLTSN